MTTRSRAALQRGNNFTTTSIVTPSSKLTTQRTHTSTAISKDQGLSFTFNPTDYIQSTDRFSIDDTPLTSTSSKFISSTRGRTANASRTTSSLQANRTGSRTRSKYQENEYTDDETGSSDYTSETDSINQTNDCPTQSTNSLHKINIHQHEHPTTPIASHQTLKHNYTHHTLLSPLHAGVSGYQDSHPNASQQPSQQSQQSQHSQHSQQFRSPIHTKINTISTPQRPSQQSQQHFQQSQQKLSTTSTTSATNVPFSESFKKSYSNPLLQPLYTIITVMGFLILALLGYVIFPLLSTSSKITLTDPILLSNGHFLTQNDLHRLQQYFITNDIFTASQTTQSAQLTSTFEKSLQSTNTVLNSTFTAQIDEIVKNIPEIAQKTFQLQAFDSKLDAKVDKSMYNGDKHEYSLEFMALNQLIDQIVNDKSQQDINLIKKFELLDAAITNLITVHEKYSSTISISDNTSKNSTSNTIIQELTQDKVIQDHFETLVTKHISTLQTELAKITIQLNKLSSSAPLAHDTKQQMSLSATVTTLHEKLINFEEQVQKNAGKLIQVEKSLNSLTLSHDQLLKRINDMNTDVITDSQLTLIKASLDSTISSTIQSLISQNLSQSLENNALLNSFVKKQDNNALLNSFVKKQDILSYMNHFVNADQTGMVDFSHSSTGSSIIQHSPQHVPSVYTLENTQSSSNMPILSMFQTKSLFGSFTDNTHIPCISTILNEIQGVGDCFTMTGRSGYVVIALNQQIYISHITIEHIAPEINPFPTAMPRYVAFYGVNNDKSRGNEDLLLEAQYQTPTHFPQKSIEKSTNDDSPSNSPQSTLNKNTVHISTIQTFKVINELALSKPYQHVKIDIKSNYGNIEFTQLYRVRIHGKIIQK